MQLSVNTYRDEKRTRDEEEGGGGAGAATIRIFFGRGENSYKLLVNE